MTLDGGAAQQQPDPESAPIVETVGEIDAISGANRLEVVRAVTGRGTELRTPAITRSGTGTLQFVNNGSQLGSDERVIVTGTAPTLVPGWDTHVERTVSGPVERWVAP